MPKIIPKRVSNYELFYDLVFVLTTSSITALLHGEHFGVRPLLSFITASFAIMSLWINETFYLNRYGERDLIDIYTIIPSMFVMGQLANNLSLDYGAHVLPFTIWMTLAFAIIALQYYLRGRKIGFEPELKNSLRFTGFMVLVFTISCCLIAIGFWPFNEFSLLIFLIPSIVPLISTRVQDYDYKIINFPHIVERVQLITIITFGETVIGILKNYQGQLLLPGFFIFIGMGFLFMFYISQTYLNINHHQETRTVLIFYAHILLIMGLNMFTVGVEMLANPHHADLGYYLFAIGSGLFLIGLLLTSTYNRDLYQITVKQWSLYFFILATEALILYLLHSWLLALSIGFAAAAYSMNRILFFYRRRARQAQEEIIETS